MLKYIKKIIRKVWDNTCFRTFNVMKNLTEGRALISILIPGLVMCFFYNQYQSRAIELERNVQKALLQGWNYTEDGEAYLNVRIETDKFPLVWDREDVEKIVVKRLNLYNYQVRAGKSNRNIGVYVKPNPTLENRVEAFYSENIEVNGSIEPTIWLISVNTKIDDNNLATELQEKGQKLPLKE